MSRYFNLDGRQIRPVVKRALQRICLGQLPEFNLKQCPSPEGLVLEIQVHGPAASVTPIGPALTQAVLDFFDKHQGHIGVTSHRNALAGAEAYTDVRVVEFPTR